MTNYTNYTTGRNNELLGLVSFVVAVAVIMAVLLWRSSVADDVQLQQMMETIDNTCQEDEDCWNCETMGNMICGPLFGK